MANLNTNSRIYVAGRAGLVGSAVVRRLRVGGFTTILTASRHELDLRDQAAVDRWFGANRPEYVFLFAGTVGGILGTEFRDPGGPNAGVAPANEGLNL